MAQEKETFLGRWSRLKREDEKKIPSAPEPKAEEPAPPPLPPVDKLTPQSDFRQFMNPKVQDALRRVALKKLFSDPHFNVPDLNEAYSGDWTGGEPITAEMLKQLNQAYTHLFSDEERKALDEERARLAAEEQKRVEADQQALEPRTDEPRRQDA